MLAGSAFSDQEVVTLSKKFIPVLVDADSERKVLQKFNVRALPTVKFTTYDGKVLSEFRGAAKPRKVVIRANKALAKAKGKKR